MEVPSFLCFASSACCCPFFDRADWGPDSPLATRIHPPLRVPHRLLCARCDARRRCLLSVEEDRRVVFGRQAISPSTNGERKGRFIKLTNTTHSRHVERGDQMQGSNSPPSPRKVYLKRTGLAHRDKYLHHRESLDDRMSRRLQGGELLLVFGGAARCHGALLPCGQPAIPVLAGEMHRCRAGAGERQHRAKISPRRCFGGPVGALNSHHRRTLELVLQQSPASFQIT